MRLEAGTRSGRTILVRTGAGLFAAALLTCGAALFGVHHTRVATVNDLPPLAAPRSSPAQRVTAPRPPPKPVFQEVSESAPRALPPRPAGPNSGAVGASSAVSDVQRQQDEALAQWVRESDDADATLDLNDHIEESLRDLELEGKLLGLSCRTTLCRLQMQFRTIVDAQRFSEQAGTPERRKRLDLTIDEEEGILVDAIVARP